MLFSFLSFCAAIQMKLCAVEVSLVISYVFCQLRAAAWQCSC